MLGNILVQGIYPEPVQLTDGLYEGAPFVEGGASRPTVRMLPLTAIGDLDGDGLADAAVLLVENSGGSGSFFFLAAVANRAGLPENVVTVPLGDRVSPSYLAIEDGAIVVDTAAFAESDPLCCPSLKVRTTYVLRGTALEIIATEPLDTAEPAPADGG